MTCNRSPATRTLSEITLGIDPGLATTGFAILHRDENHLHFTLKECGTIVTSKGTLFAKRLVEIEKNLVEVLSRHDVSSAAVEQLFFTVNKKTALAVAHARGVILHTLYCKGVAVMEYSPLQVKKALTGNGRATKLEVQGMVGSLLRLKKPIKQDDAADAVAVAICHFNSSPLRQMVQEGSLVLASGSLVKNDIRRM